MVNYDFDLAEDTQQEMEAQAIAVYNVASFVSPHRSPLNVSSDNSPYGSAFSQSNSSLVKQEPYPIEGVPANPSINDGYCYQPGSHQSSPSGSPQNCHSLASSPEMNHCSEKQEIDHGDNFWSQNQVDESRSLCDTTEEECIDAILATVSGSFPQMTQQQDQEFARYTVAPSVGTTADSRFSQYQIDQPMQSVTAACAGAYPAAQSISPAPPLAYNRSASLPGGAQYRLAEMTRKHDGPYHGQHILSRGMSCSNWSYDSPGTSEQGETDLDLNQNSLHRSRSCHSPKSLSDSEALPDTELISISVRDLNRRLRGMR